MFGEVGVARARAQLHALGRGQRDQPVRAPSLSDELSLFLAFHRGREGEREEVKKRMRSHGREGYGQGEREMKQRGLKRRTEDGEVRVRCEPESDRGVDGKEGEKGGVKEGCFFLCHSGALELSLDLQTAVGEV